jgi:hypothetical protein
VIRIQTLRLPLPALCGFIAAWPFKAQRQTLFTVEAVDAFVIVAPALTPEHHVYPAVSVVNSRFGDLTDTQAQRAVIGSNGTIPERAAAEPECKADLSFAGTVPGL